MVKIGHIKTSELWNVNHKRLSRYMKKFIPFLTINNDSECLDMGESNPKMQYIKNELSINVKQVCGYDFNFDYLVDYYGTSDVIFALEIVEHVQNPLWFMREMSRCLNDNGSIYITIPSNTKWLWMDGHYFEIPKKHFEKWIIKPLGLRIVRYKRINFVHDWWGLLIGYRPLISLIRGEISFKSLIRKVLYYKYDVYEIKKQY